MPPFSSGTVSKLGAPSILTVTTNWKDAMSVHLVSLGMETNSASLAYWKHDDPPSKDFRFVRSIPHGFEVLILLK